MTPKGYINVGGNIVPQDTRPHRATPAPDPSLLPFRAILDWWMCSDPWPANEQGHTQIEAWLNEECKRRGYESWVDAYHQEPDVAGSPNCWGRVARATAHLREHGAEAGGEGA